MGVGLQFPQHHHEVNPPHQRLSRKTQGYRWCLWESVVPCTLCQGEKCPFYIWENPRTGKLEPLCKGRALKSDGFIPLEAAIDEYYATDAETFASGRAC